MQEVRAELASLFDPALDAGLGGVERPEGNAEGGLLPRASNWSGQRLSAHLGYAFSFSTLEGDPEAFLERVENHWRGEGLVVEVQETDDARFVYSGKDGYSIRAVIVYDSMEVDIAGSGPCVDNPDPD